MGVAFGLSRPLELRESPSAAVPPKAKAAVGTIPDRLTERQAALSEACAAGAVSVADVQALAARFVELGAPGVDQDALDRITFVRVKHPFGDIKNGEGGVVTAFGRGMMLLVGDTIPGFNIYHELIHFTQFREPAARQREMAAALDAWDRTEVESSGKAWSAWVSVRTVITAGMSQERRDTLNRRVLTRWREARDARFLAMLTLEEEDEHDRQALSALPHGPAAMLADAAIVELSHEEWWDARAKLRLVAWAQHESLSREPSSPPDWTIALRQQLLFELMAYALAGNCALDPGVPLAGSAHIEGISRAR